MKMEAQIRLINIDSIIPNRFQPRLTFNEEALNELASSIREHGIIQPLVVRRAGDKFEIIAGERRYKASQIAGLTAVPAIISDLDDNESAEVAILENTNRKNLSAIEEAKSYKKLLDRKYVTQDQLAQRLGTSQSNIANKIRLLSLDDTVQTALLKEQISERHARSLLKVTDKFKQVDLLNHIINEKWPVRRLDEEIDKIIGNYRQEAAPGAINSNSRIDVNVDDIMDNSEDLFLEEEYVPKVNYQYDSNIREKKKSSLFFNNLEDSSVNMDSSMSFGFNPFMNSVDTDNAVERDYDLLELDDTDDIIKAEDFETTAEQQVEVQQVVVEEEYKTMDDVIAGIKKIIKNAKKNEVAIDLEEFSFEKYYQFIIRLNKEKKEEN